MALTNLCRTRILLIQLIMPHLLTQRRRIRKRATREEKLNMSRTRASKKAEERVIIVKMVRNIQMTGITVAVGNTTTMVGVWIRQAK